MTQDRFSPLRRVTFALIRSVFLLVYRMRLVHPERVPATGGALLIGNHVSFLDGVFVQMLGPRPVRFIVDESYFQKRFVGGFLRWIDAIPIASRGGPRVLLKALRDAGRHLDEGRLVCLFPEGELTRSGSLQSFKRGVERLLSGRDVPVIPFAIDGVWGSFFTASGKGFFRKWPSLRRRVEVRCGEALPASSSPAELRVAVQRQICEAKMDAANRMAPLHHGFLRSARRRPWALAYADSTGMRLSRLRASMGAAILARRLPEGERVATLLPPSCGAAVAQLAISMAGRVSVNLNYTSGPAAMGSALEQTGCRSVLTSRVFLEKAGIELPEGIEAIELRDLLGDSTGLEKLARGLELFLLGPRALDRSLGADRERDPNQPATVIFSSGSTGEPKGVLLSHANIASNADAVLDIVRLSQGEGILGILPFFHSFGVLAFWLSSRAGLPSVFHPNPLDAVTVGELVESYRLRLMLATPSFLELYRRRIPAGQFGSLRLVVAGAEKLRPATADAFEDAFGVRPLEGYGATECAPVIAVNAPGYRAAGFYQPGERRGSVGRPLPGVALRVVDPDTGEALEADEPGRLLVRGPNVMMGYLGREDLSAAALKDGWYDTGDVVRVDVDGFVTITDRLSRFSKIGGEMVPHGRVETELQDLLADGEPVCAVTAIPDPKKGERLVLIHLDRFDEAAVGDALDRLPGRGLPNLFVPRKEDCVAVPELPLLGTGKLDLRGLKALALASD